MLRGQPFEAIAVFCDEAIIARPESQGSAGWTALRGHLTPRAGS